jgi:hypothetical protein
MHVHLYFDSTIDVAGIPTELAENMSATWSTVVQKASEKEQTISIEDQRIILCTLSFIIYDFMTVKVKESKSANTSMYKPVLPVDDCDFEELNDTIDELC